MKKAVALIVVWTLLLCLTSCSVTQSRDDTVDDVPDTTAQDTAATEKAPVEEKKSLTTADVIDRIQAYSKENGLDPISDLEKKPGETTGQIVTTFGCMNGLVSVSITATNGNVDYVMAVCLPTQVMEKVQSTA